MLVWASNQSGFTLIELKPGAAIFLTKPCSRKQLIQAVGAVLR